MPLGMMNAEPMTRREPARARRELRGVYPLEAAYLSVREACEYVAISEPVFRRLVATGRGPQALRIEGCALTRFAKSDLDLWMRSQAVTK
jgi:excisionase family DNA binding protein